MYAGARPYGIRENASAVPDDNYTSEIWKIKEAEMGKNKKNRKKTEKKHFSNVN
jgi:hypothetical protein